ncbi:LysR family transcriptional regulator [Amycolatopsis sp. K13G38]|uniref:LysR family transcriptional regulator n=1 Tax=Amycolatopsis acididurans TaxID=2724524 RepID=A0ABX1J1Z1_9PSEU|nr:LysR family transcriptional regulator [Amycolatopsis acididurans]NKQ52370.1 LysR family transcriptional regulator [Amycolatopsis acididurans]
MSLPDGHRDSPAPGPAQAVPAPEARSQFERLSTRVPEIGALELLLSVARCGSLGQAAREHGISQPAAGSRIRNLERLLGLALIERSAAGSRLTPEGAMVEQWAREVVRAAAGLDAAVAALRAHHERRLRIAASMTVAEYLIPGWLTELHARRPRATVALRVVNSTEVAQLVAADAADIGFIEGPEMPEGLQCQVVGRDRLRLVVAPTHPWARRRYPVSAADLAATPMVVREPGSGTRDTVEAVLAEHGPLAAPLVELSSTTAIKAAVEAGLGPAVLSSLAVAAELADGRLVAVEMAGVELGRVLRAVWPAGRRLTGILRDVVAVARQQTAARVQSSA